MQDSGTLLNDFIIGSTFALASEESLEFQTYVLPDKRYGRGVRNLRYTWLSMYRRLNSLVLTANAIALIVVLVSRKLDHTSIQSITTASASNLTVAILVRQELVVDSLYLILGKCPRWMPLRVRRAIAKIYHLGGIHSGAAIAAGIWLAALNVPVFTTLPRTNVGNILTALRVVMGLLDICLFSIISLSIPVLRSRFHDLWEGIHRYVGWLTLLLFWALLLLMTEASSLMEGHSDNIGILLVITPAFWCLVLSTMAIIIPWMNLKKVPIRPEPLSSHAIRLHFSHRNAHRCASLRFSDKPLMDWHPFACIPSDNTTGFSILVSRAGDWTARVIDIPPTELWTKGVPVRGVIHMAQLFNKVVLVATGSGIGPTLSLLTGRKLDVRIVWSTPDPISTFGKTIVSRVRDADPDAIVINTTEVGRPNLLQVAFSVYVISGAEAVFVISNATTTRHIVYGLESRNVPVFAPIFDS